MKDNLQLRNFNFDDDKEFVNVKLLQFIFKTCDVTIKDVDKIIEIYQA